VLSNGGGPTTVVPPALLTNRAPSAAAAGSAGEPGEGGFNPFTPVAPPPAAAPADDGLPWPWIALAAVLVAAIAGVFAMRARKPPTVVRKPPNY
jgi:hypothetical protein